MDQKTQHIVDTLLALWDNCNVPEYRVILQEAIDNIHKADISEIASYTLDQFVRCSTIRSDDRVHFDFIAVIKLYRTENEGVSLYKAKVAYDKYYLEHFFEIRQALMEHWDVSADKVALKEIRVI